MLCWSSWLQQAAVGDWFHFSPFLICTQPASNPVPQQPLVPQVPALGVSVGPSTPSQEHQAAGWGAGWSGCCRRIPPNSRGVSLFHFFFLRNSSCLSLGPHTRACPLTQPTSPNRLGTVRVRAIRPNSQLFLAGTHSLRG